MFRQILLLPLLVVRLTALYTPLIPSIIQLPTNTNATASTNLLQFAEWPAVPWTYRSSSTPSAIEFVAYGRQASINRVQQITQNLDTIILKLLRVRGDTITSGKWQYVDGIVGVSIQITGSPVRVTSMVVALQQVRDLMGFEYGPREIELAGLMLGGEAQPVAVMEVLFAIV